MRERTEEIYLDSNATTPLSPVVIETIVKSLHEEWGNASSCHHLGKVSKAAILKGRQQVANMIDAGPNEIIFTSGGTEANHTVLNTFSSTALNSNAMLSICNSFSNLPHIITSTIEHDSIKLTLERMTHNKHVEVTSVPVNPETAAVDVADVMAAIQPNTVLVSIMLANNETGVLQPVNEISTALKQYCSSKGRTIYMHTDAAQAIGKIPVSVKDLDVHYLTIVGHKFYGPRIGALFVKNLGSACSEAPFRPVFVGGGQESGYRAGTENTAMIAGLGKACELVTNHIDEYQKNMTIVRDKLEQLLADRFGVMVTINVKKTNRLPNTSSVSFFGDAFRGRRVLQYCVNVIAGVGAACHSHDGNECGSAVLRASGVSVENARNAIRFSVGRSTTLDDVERAVHDLSNALEVISNSMCT